VKPGDHHGVHGVLVEYAGVCSSFTKLKYVFQQLDWGKYEEFTNLRRKKMESVLH
jgi:hypothetical protein